MEPPAAPTTGNPTLDLLLTVAGIVIALGSAYAVLRKTLFPAVRRVQDFLDDWNGEDARPGVQARPGVMEQLGTLRKQMGRANHQLWPNGGSSLKDSVNRTEQVAKSTETKLSDHIEQSAEIIRQGKATEEAMWRAIEQLAHAAGAHLEHRDPD